jgi:hypothetical protein
MTELREILSEYVIKASWTKKWEVRPAGRPYWQHRT